MTQFYVINCRTHLHVGSGDSNYGVIDKLVQRDPAVQLPCIFASSLKGAFREFFKHYNGEEITNQIFGSGDSGKSQVVFHQAHVLSIPVRSNQFPYFNLIAPVVIDELISQLELLNIDNNSLVAELIRLKETKQDRKAIVYNVVANNLKIEDFEGDDIVNLPNYHISDSLLNIIGNNPAMVSNSDFLDLCSDYRLPVIARNNLENGQSKNLWYEQIIPRISRFFFAVSTVGDVTCDTFFNEFTEDRKVQIGANATIGYGVCSISKL